jgi:hypothetical protein
VGASANNAAGPHGLGLALKALAVLTAALFTAVYLFAALPRIVYPYDLDFIEDSLLMQSLRHAQGQPVYGPPNAEFMPHVYMPLYMWLGGLLFRLTGPGFVPLRLMSFTATLVTAAMIGGIARRESGQTWLGIACAGLYLGGYRLTGFWYELARVDSLYVALTLAALTIGVYRGRSARGMALAAAVMALALFTKQTAVIFAGALGAHLLWANGRRAWVSVITFALLTALPLLAINALTGGWFWFNVFSVAVGDPVEAARVWHYVVADVLGGMAGLSLAALAALSLGWRRAGWKILREQPWLFGLAAALLVSGLGRASVGGNLNNLMPAYALLCLAPALLARAWQRERPSSPRWASSLIAATIVLQFTLGVYNPLRYIPTAEMRASGDRLIQRLAMIDGEVLVLMHPYYAHLAGKAPSTQIIHPWYLYAYGNYPLPDDFVERIRTRYYAAIVSDESLFETEPVVRDLIERYYAPAERLTESDAPPTLAGMVTRPEVIYRPKP